MQKNIVNIYTDGACKGNPGVGGWAALLVLGNHRKIISGSTEYTTSNRMELTAAIEGLKALKKACEVNLTSDSQYVVYGIHKMIEYKKIPTVNKDLWLDLLDLVSKYKVNSIWIRGHSGHPENEMVDREASKAAITLQKELKKG